MVGRSDYLAGNIEAALSGDSPSPDRALAKVRAAITDLKSNPQAYAADHAPCAGLFDRNREMERLQSALARIEALSTTTRS